MLADRMYVVWPCDGQFGVLARKCTVCARSRHKCVEVEQVLYPQLRTVVAARDAHVAAVRSSNTAEQQEQQQKFSDACDSLVAALDRLDRNRSKVIGDRRTPRKSFAGAASASSSAFEEARLLELQSLRRSILALVAVGKEVSFLSVFTAPLRCFLC